MIILYSEWGDVLANKLRVNGVAWKLQYLNEMRSISEKNWNVNPLASNAAWIFFLFREPPRWFIAEGRRQGGGGWGILGEIPWFSGGNGGRGILVVTKIVWTGEATEYWPSIKETGENNIEPYKGIR